MIFIGWFAWKIHDTFKALHFLSIPTKQHTGSTNGMSWGRDYLFVWPIAQKQKTWNVQVYLFICYSLFNDMTYSALKAVTEKSVAESEVVSWKTRSLNLLLFILGY